MDHPSVKDEEFAIDLENGDTDGSIDIKNLKKLNIDNNLMKLSIINPSTVINGSSDNILKVVIDSQIAVSRPESKKIDKQKRKKASSVKKPPKPPRPPRGFSLDAADQKLIKEIAELAMIKKARIARMNAIKQKKALKGSTSSSSSMSGSLFAMVFTVIFIMMILLQGTSYRSSSGVIQEQVNPSASDSILPNSKSSNLFEKITGSRYAIRKIIVDQ